MRHTKGAVMAAWCVVIAAIIFTTGEPEMPKESGFADNARAGMCAAYEHAVEVSQGKSYTGPMSPEVRAQVILRRAHEIRGIGNVCMRMGCRVLEAEALEMYEELDAVYRDVEREGRA